MRRRMYFAVMALCEATSATSLQTRVRMQSRSPQAAVRQISSKVSEWQRLLLAILFVSVCDSQLQTVMIKVDLE